MAIIGLSPDDERSLNVGMALLQNLNKTYQQQGQPMGQVGQEPTVQQARTAELTPQDEAMINQAKIAELLQPEEKTPELKPSYQPALPAQPPKPEEKIKSDQFRQNIADMLRLIGAVVGDIVSPGPGMPMTERYQAMRLSEARQQRAEELDRYKLELEKTLRERELAGRETKQAFDIENEKARTIATIEHLNKQNQLTDAETKKLIEETKYIKDMVGIHKINADVRLMTEERIAEWQGAKIYLQKERINLDRLSEMRKMTEKQIDQELAEQKMVSNLSIQEYRAINDQITQVFKTGMDVLKSKYEMGDISAEEYKKQYDILREEYKRNMPKSPVLRKISGGIGATEEMQDVYQGLKEMGKENVAQPPTATLGAPPPAPTTPASPLANDLDVLKEVARNWSQYANDNSKLMSFQKKLSEPTRQKLNEYVNQNGNWNLAIGRIIYELQKAMPNR